MGNTSGNCQSREGVTPSAPDEMDSGGVSWPLTSGGEDMMVKTKATKGPMDTKETVKKRGASQARTTLAGDAMEQPVKLPNGMWERIAKQAYELWERCGCREGHDLQDWLDAEKIVMKEMHEARE